MSSQGDGTGESKVSWIAGDGFKNTWSLDLTQKKQVQLPLGHVTPEVDRETGTEDIGTVAKKDWNRKAKGEFPAQTVANALPRATGYLETFMLPVRNAALYKTC